MEDLKGIIQLATTQSTNLADDIIKLGGIIVCTSCDHQEPVTKEILEIKLNGKYSCPKCSAKTKWLTQTELEKPRDHSS